MSDASTATFLDLVSGRRGHFQLESGHHGALWLDLDPLFADARRIAPLVELLASQLRPFDVHVVCGPLLGGAFLAQLVARELGAEFVFTQRDIPDDASGMYQARYHLPASLAGRVRGQRVAMVDDVMSAGSALRGTLTALLEREGNVVAAGALMVLGDTGARFLAERAIPVLAAARDAYELWTPGECPMCAAGTPLETP